MIMDNESTERALFALASQGETILLVMAASRPEGSASVEGLTEALHLAQMAVQWVSLTAMIVQVVLGAEFASEIMGNQGRASEARPRPAELSDDLASYWDSVASRIDLLRGWEADLPAR